MNTKNLIIAFITVSIAALIVSAFAVFAAARSQYSALLTSATEAPHFDKTEVTEKIKAPETTFIPETSSSPETSKEIPETETCAETFTEETQIDISTETEAETSQTPSAYILKLEGDRLVLLSPDGTAIRERIISSASLHPKDREALLAGISFSDENDAMSAIYDIIS